MCGQKRRLGVGYKQSNQFDKTSNEQKTTNLRRRESRMNEIKVERISGRKKERGRGKKREKTKQVRIGRKGSIGLSGIQ